MELSILLSFNELQKKEKNKLNKTMHNTLQYDNRKEIGPYGRSRFIRHLRVRACHITHVQSKHTHTPSYTLITFGIHNRLTIEDTIYFGFAPRLEAIDRLRLEGKEWHGFSISRCGIEVHILVGADYKADDSGKDIYELFLWC